MRLARVAAKLSQTELGAAVGVGQNTVSDWENGNGLPEGRVWLLLADALQCNGHWLLTDEGQMERPSEQPDVDAARDGAAAAAYRRIERIARELRTATSLPEWLVEMEQGRPDRGDEPPDQGGATGDRRRKA